MSEAANPYASFGTVAAQAPADARTTFIRKTYTHLAAAIYGFVAIEWALFQLVPEATLQNSLVWLQRGYNGLLFLGGFMVVSWIANRWALSGASRGKQYAGLLLYMAAEALFMLPLLYFAQRFGGGANVIATAGVITLVVFGGLTAFVFLSRADFSFLRSFLVLGIVAAFGLLLCGAFFGFHLGVAFTVGMIVLACGYILYDTSNVLHHYRTDQYVAASLALFASVALLFWYVLQLVMNRD